MVAAADEPESASKLPLVLMGALVTIAVLVTVALVAKRGPQSFEPGTPEAALQTFIEAGLEGDDDTLLSLVAPEHREACSRDLDRFGRRSYHDDYRVELESVEVDGAEAELTVEFRNANRDDPFASGTWSFEERFDLVRSGDDWLIDRARWPHVFAACTAGAP